MKFDYSDANVIQGRANQDMARENPNTFATESGADRVSQGSPLDKPKQRMAGQMGSRLLEYLNNPEEQQRTDNWMARFGMSNEGMQFNQAKMGIPPGGAQ